MQTQREKALCEDALPNLLPCSVPSAIHRSSCNSVARVPTPPPRPSSQPLTNQFFSWVSFLVSGSLGGFSCPPSSTSFSACCLLSLLPLFSRLLKTSRLLLPVFWFPFLPLTSFSISGALKHSLHLFLKNKCCFFIFPYLSLACNSQVYPLLIEIFFLFFSFVLSSISDGGAIPLSFYTCLSKSFFPWL